MKKVSVIGAGSWGSALAVLLANNGHEVTLWTHDPHEIEMLSTKREQVEKLPGVKHVSLQQWNNINYCNYL